MPGNQFYGYLGSFSLQRPTESDSPIQGGAQRDSVFDGHRGQLLLSLTSWLPCIHNSVGYSNFINKCIIVYILVFPLRFQFKDFIFRCISWWTLLNLPVKSNWNEFQGSVCSKTYGYFLKNSFPFFKSQGREKEILRCILSRTIPLCCPLCASNERES